MTVYRHYEIAMTAQNTITDFVLETFRLNGRLLASGDALVADLGLTSARWQVIGAVALSPVPLSVAQIARNMGLTPWRTRWRPTVWCGSHPTRITSAPSSSCSRP